MANPYPVLFLVGIYQIPSRNSLSPHRKSNISIRLSIMIQVRFSSKGSATSLSRTTASVSSVGTFVNRLTTSKITIWLGWIEASLILSTKRAVFLTYDEDLPLIRLMISTRNWLTCRTSVTDNGSQKNINLMNF